MDEEKNIVKESTQKVNLSGIIFLLVLLLACNIYICLNFFRQSHSNENIDSSHRVLLLTMEDKISNKDASDDVQVKNALKNGGTIRVKDSNEGYQNAFGYEYERYGAVNSSGTYWTKGAVLNYIASRGWTLIQAPSSGLTTTYYFIK